MLVVLASAKVAIASQSASMLAGLAINISIGAPWTCVKYLEYHNWDMWSCQNNCPGYMHTLSSLFFGWLFSWSAALFMVCVCNVRLAVQILWTNFPLWGFISAGGSQDREWSHQPQGCRAGWFCGSVQNQKAHTPQQTHEGLLWTTGESTAEVNLRQCVLKALYMQSSPFLLWCFSQGLQIRQIRFRFDGQPINETDTPAQVRERGMSPF